MNKRMFRRSIVGGVAISALIMSGAANAQETTATDDGDDVVEVVTETTTTEDEARQEKIVVTGSLLARDEFASSSPIQVITAEVATLEGLVDTAALLQGSSLAAGSTQLNNTFQNFVTNGGIGAQTIDLRGCGDTRTLVLVDGKRPGPSGTRGSVASLDLNVLPQSIISRVEVLKDGASTIYGSDAVCGVVNIITRDTVDRPELNFNISRPFDSGGEQYSVSGAWGFQLGDSANFTLSAEYRLDEELDTSERDYLDCQRDYVRNPNGKGLIDRLNYSATATDPAINCSNLYHNTVSEYFTRQRLVPTPGGGTIPLGTIGTSIPGYKPRVGTGIDPNNGSLYYEDILDSPMFDNQDFYPRNENLSFFATADVDLNGIQWDSEFLFSRRSTDVEGWRQFFPYVGGNMNIPATILALQAFYGVDEDTATALAPNYTDLVTYYGDPTYTNDLETLVQAVMPYPVVNNIDVDYYYASTSLSGGFSPGFMDKWSWKVDGSYSRGEGTYAGNAIMLSKSGDWNYDGTDYNDDGEIDFVGPPELNYLDPGFLSGERVDELVAAIGGYQEGNTVYEQTTFTAVLAGELLDLPAGPLGLGVGVEYREFSIDDQPGELTQSGDIWGSSTAGPTKGTNSVSEIFAEISVPLLKGAPLAEDVEFSGSVRAFDYDIGGSDAIYKAGLNWQITPTFRARSSYGTSYRAPALFELFLEDQTGFQTQTAIDPCVNWGESQNANIRANCAAAGIPDDYLGGTSSALVITSGGGDRLEPETGNTFTAGLIWTPTFSDINIALDYYEIEINDQITSLSAAQIVGGCYGSPTYPNDFCTLFERGEATSTSPYALDNIQAPTLNVDSQSQTGLDLEIRYSSDFNFGTVTLDSSINWAFERYINVFGSDFVSGIDNNDFNGTVGYPSVVGDLSARLDRGDWTYTWFTSFIGRQDDNRYYDDDFNEPQPYIGSVVGLYKAYTEAQWTHGLSVRWQGDTWSITGGINNIFDEHPPSVSPDVVQVSAGNTPVGGTGYDLRGRRAFVSVSKTF